MTTIKFFPTFLLLVLLCMEHDVCISGGLRCIERERNALLKFKQGLKNDSVILSSWGSEDNKKECCNWDGVLCNNSTGHVIGLRLLGYHDDGNYYQGLGGEVSPALLELHHLSTLELYDHNFEGNRIPEFIGSMKMLRHLNLSQSNFSGTVPHQLGNLTNLQTLNLSDNHLTGTVPHQLENLTNLQTLDFKLNDLSFENLNWLSHLSLLSQLDLSENNVSDANWLQQILKLHSLKELHLSRCQLIQVTSSARPFINSSATSLSVLDLSSNDLNSSTFDWLFNLNLSFVKIDLSGNGLHGPLPDAFGKMLFLEQFTLSRNKLQGRIPRSLGNLSHLQSLDLSSNDFREPFVDFIWSLLFKVNVSLKSLYMSSNQLTGLVPDSSSGLALRELRLGSNRLTGSVPENFFQLPELEALDVYNNSLEGTITERHFMKLHNLKELDLSLNAFKLNITPDWSPPFQLDAIILASCEMGLPFPAWLKTQRNFKNLDLSSANITGEVPSWLWNLSSNLTRLNLSRNELSGGIPDLSFIAGLVVIDISFNKFSGPVPMFPPHPFVLQMSNNMFHGSISSICQIQHSALYILDFSSNQLSGKLPSCWAKMECLRLLDLSNNCFSGEIPPSLVSLSSLKCLVLRNNNFSGKFPHALSKGQGLAIIDVGENRLAGNIPTWIGTHCRFIKVLSFKQNDFHGSIPLELCHLTELHVLDLSANNISGRIPSCFNNFTRLAQNIRSNESSIGIFGFGMEKHMDEYIGHELIQWKGQDFEFGNTLGLVTYIDLSSNRLGGSIPQEIYHLKGLRSLNLSQNQLSGQLNSGIGQMMTLEILDLSRNQLSGGIPDSMAELHSLAFLDLAYNNLSGKIPNGTQLQSFKASAYASNPKLCGRPLETCPGDYPPTAISNHGKQGFENEEDEGFLMSFLKEFGLSISLGFIVGFWGLVGPLLLSTSWRNNYFNFMGKVGDWLYLYMTTTIFLRRLRR